MDSQSAKCKTRQPGGVEKGVCQVKYMDNVEEAGRGRDNAMKNYDECGRDADSSQASVAGRKIYGYYFGKELN